MKLLTQSGRKRSTFNKQRYSASAYCMKKWKKVQEQFWKQNKSVLDQIYDKFVELHPEMKLTKDYE
jgi:hypothetical protein